MKTTVAVVEFQLKLLSQSFHAAYGSVQFCSLGIDFVYHVTMSYVLLLLI